MASVFIHSKPESSEIDYSLVDGRVRFFVLHGVKIYDEQDGTKVDGWRDRLVKFVLDLGLDGYAFVNRMKQDGLLSDPESVEKQC